MESGGVALLGCTMFAAIFTGIVGAVVAMSRYAYAEIDYLLRYYYDIDIAEGWRLRNGVGPQSV